MRLDKLPTFRSWSKKLFAQKRAIIVILLIVGTHSAISKYLKEYYAVILPCNHPCQDALTCDPLEFSFEISPSTLKTGEKNNLWYRARLKNKSCSYLKSLYVPGFIDSKDLSKVGHGIWVTVAGPDGKEIERRPIPFPDGGISWNYGDKSGVDISTKGTIYPYQPNFELVEKLTAAKKLNDYFLNLAPGETFESISPIVRPYRKVAWSFTSEDGGIGDGYRLIPVENPPKFPDPPAGFNILDRYEFKRPGRYTVTGGFDATLRVYPRFERYEARGAWVDFFFKGIHPAIWDSAEREFHFRAPPVVLEVSR